MRVTTFLQVRNLRFKYSLIFCKNVEKCFLAILVYLLVVAFEFGVLQCIELVVTVRSLEHFRVQFYVCTLNII